MGDVLPVGIVYEAVEGGCFHGKGADRRPARATVTRGIRVLGQDGTLDICLYSVPSMLG